MFEPVGYQTIYWIHVDVPNSIRFPACQELQIRLKKGPKMASEPISEHQISLEGNAPEGIP